MFVICVVVGVLVGFLLEVELEVVDLNMFVICVVVGVLIELFVMMVGQVKPK